MGWKLNHKRSVFCAVTLLAYACLDQWQLPFAHWKRAIGTRNIQKAKETARRHRQRSVYCRAMPELQSVAESAWQGYESLLDSQGLATDVATAAVLNSASDVVAQLSEMQREDGRVIRAERALRYAAFGSMDGCAGHYWFTVLDTTLPRSGDDVVDTVAKVLADSAVYTPCWCVAFLFVMAVLEGRGPRTGVLEVRRDFWSLLKGNYGITLPFVALIYGLAPVRYQVACFAALTLAYTIVLSLWASARDPTDAIQAESDEASLLYEVGAAIGRALPNKLKRKELFEAFEVACLVQRQARQESYAAGTVVDLCAGCGLLGVFLALMWPRARVIAMDRKQSVLSRMLAEGAITQWPLLRDRFEWKVCDMRRRPVDNSAEPISLPSDCMVVACHACGLLTDEAIAAACSGSLRPMVLVPCKTPNQDIVEFNFYDSYKLGKKLGQGTFGQVRLAKDKLNGKELAVKIVDVRHYDDKTGVCTGQISRTRNKATRDEVVFWKRVCAAECEHVVLLHRAFSDNSLYYMVCERCKRSMLDMTVDGLTEPDLSDIFKQMIKGVLHTHRAEIVHRDVKPDNFLWGGPEHRTLKLCDFGLAAAMPQVGKLFGVYGTAPYMAPEMLTNVGYDYLVDIWSLGAVAFLLTYGRFPYTPVEQTSASMKEAIIKDSPPLHIGTERVSDGAPCSDLLLSFIQSTLSRDPSARPTADLALEHAFFESQSEVAADHDDQEQDGEDAEDEEAVSARPMTHIRSLTHKMTTRPSATVQNGIDELLQKLFVKHGGEAAGSNMFFSEGDEDTERNQADDSSPTISQADCRIRKKNSRRNVKHDMMPFARAQQSLKMRRRNDLRDPSQHLAASPRALDPLPTYMEMVALQYGIMDWQRIGGVALRLQH
ncbi:MKK1 [Symbiodinium necroappetens]|uniref:MKK1 protein n=1 Tax=Symbiodinium necroappetens TaxID=1628268 RepID=A0A812Y1E6_9DINO|nr:MKK1 [Symbiodinium necroappetens]